MKRALYLGVLLAGMLVCVPVHAQTGERIVSFDDAIAIKADASIDVVEHIVYDFGSSQHHGIFRDIPVTYSTSYGTRSITLSRVTVTDQFGSSVPFSISRQGQNEEIRIGDPNTFVTGEKTYTISYTVDRAITYFPNYDELYWNVTGNGWQVPIGEASATVTLPSGAFTQVACYEGVFGSTDRCTQDLSIASSSAVRFTAAQPLHPGDGVTIAVGFAKGVVHEPTAFENVLELVLDNGVLALPVVVFFGMFVLWWYKGRDPRGRGTVVPEYASPNNLTPLQTYAVLHSNTSNSAISAEIVYLATKGYVKITKINEKILIFNHTDYSLTKLKPGDDLAPHDQALLDGLFKTGDMVKLSELKNKFYRELPLIKKATTVSVVDAGYFAADPQKVAALYIGAGVLISVLSFVLLGALGGLGIIAGAVSGVIVLLFGLIMPKVTKDGAIMRERIKGLSMYMTVAEKDRINFHNAPAKNPEHFEALLPFAMVLGVEKEWAKQFEGIYLSQPSWYSDPAMTAFNPVFFASDLRSFSAGAASTLAAAPGGGSGSGGGGFSGGGFGGGGGGSW